MLAPVDWSGVRTFVEYGPGIGTFTPAVLDVLRPDAKLIAIDTNAEFTRHLRRSIRDPRLHAVRGSAVDVSQILDGLGESDLRLDISAAHGPSRLTFQAPKPLCSTQS